MMAAALLFWGWQTGFIVVAVVMAAVMEARSLIDVRWDLSRTDFNRISDVSAVLLVLIAVYQLLGNDSARAVLAILQWLPLIVFPLVACQLYSARGVLDASIFFWSLRRRANVEPDYAGVPVDLAYPFVALTLLSASAANTRSGLFFVGFAAVTVWALWGVRARRYPTPVWIGMIAAALALGFAGQLGLAAGQRALERMATAWFLDYLRREADPYRSTTALGQVGELKLSSRIVLRVETPKTPPPALLREASYNVYNAPTWYAVDAPFRSVTPESDGATWRLTPRTAEAGPVTVSAYLRRGKGMLAVPNGTVELANLLVVELASNRMGAVRVEEGLGLVRYGVRYAGAAADDPPTRMDLAVPRGEAHAVGRIADDLQLAGRPPREAVAAVHAYFRDGFRYSRFVADRAIGTTALEDFLGRTRRGHCEYFATATVLLLRAAGMPARYAVGYAVHEWSALERRYVVRANDAHAWALAWLDGAWREVDTTPPDWMEAEREAVSSFTVGDLWSWGGYLFARWRWSEREDRLTGSVGWLLVPLFLLLAWRLYSRRRITRRPARVPRGVRAIPRGADSAFYDVERTLARLAFPRAPAEPLSVWLRRIASAGLPGLDTARLPALLALHYRYRFDPVGLAAEERAVLASEARTWLTEHSGAPR